MPGIVVGVVLFGSVVSAAHPGPLFNQYAGNAAPIGPAADGDGCPSSAAVTEVLFSAVNLSWPGLEKVRRAYHNDDNRTACNELAAYYANANTSGWLRNPGPTCRPSRSRVGGAVDAVIWNDTYDFYGEVGKVPRNKDGGLDWCVSQRRMMFDACCTRACIQSGRTKSSQPK